MRKKKKAELAEQNTVGAPAPKVPTEQEYREYVARAEADLDRDLSALESAADNLKSSAKEISKVKGIFSSKLSRRKVNKYGTKLEIYKSDLNEYFALNSRVSWLMRTLASCCEGLARSQTNARSASSIRSRCDKILANAEYKKAKIEKKLDGVVMPVVYNN